jgi:hypothetical protein
VEPLDQTHSITDELACTPSQHTSDVAPVAPASSVRLALTGSLVAGSAFQASATAVVEIPRVVVTVGALLALLIIGYLVLRPVVRSTATVATVVGAIPVFA